MNILRTANGSGTAHAASTLESRYRRLLTLLPSAYRERRAEEMLGVLLDGAGEEQRWPRAVEVASLAGLAVRLRTGAAGGSVRASAFGEVLQRFALAGLIIQALYYATLVAEMVVLNATGPSFVVWALPDLLIAGIVGIETVLPAAALVCLVRGRIRTGRVLAVLGLGAVCAQVMWASFTGQGIYVFPVPEILTVVAPVVISLMAAAAVLFGFHRDAPDAAAPGRWLRILMISLSLVLVCTGAAQFLADHGSTAADWLGAVAHLVVAPITPAAAVMFGFSRARRPVIWSTGLLVLSVPVMAVATPLVILLFAHMSLQNLQPGPALIGQSLPELAWEAVVTQLILAVACWSAIRRRGAGLAPSSGPGLAGSA
jgi:hypothetical protein